MARTQQRKKASASGKKPKSARVDPLAPAGVDLEVVRALRTAEDWSGLIAVLTDHADALDSEAGRALCRAYIHAVAPSEAVVAAVSAAVTSLDENDVDGLGARAKLALSASDFEAASRHALAALNACHFQDSAILKLLQEAQKSIHSGVTDVRWLCQLVAELDAL